MKVTVAVVSGSPRKVQGDLLYPAVREYIARVCQYAPCEVVFYSTEEHLLSSSDKKAGRSVAALILFDEPGKRLTSTQFSAEIGRLRDAGRQQIVLAIGPADGWSDQARTRADVVVSLGPMTMPHVLALVVAAEQLYRAWTILAGHPYHMGH